MDGYQVFAPTCWWTQLVALTVAILVPFGLKVALNFAFSGARQRRAAYRRAWVQRTR
jgi:hypothetical protein